MEEPDYVNLIALEIQKGLRSPEFEEALRASLAAPTPGDVKDFPRGPHTSTLTLPAGETWKQPAGFTNMQASLMVEGTLLMNEPGAGLRHVGINEDNFIGGGMDPMPETDIGIYVVGTGQLNLSNGWSIEGTPGGRSHIWIQSSVPQFLTDGTIQWCGPQEVVDGEVEGVAGRFPLHFHHCRDGSRGSRVTRVTVKDSGHHAFWPHVSNGIRFDECLALRTQQRAYGWDSGDISNDIEWINCRAEQVGPITGQRGVSLGAFFLGRGSGNRMIGCSTANCHGDREAAGVYWTSKANDAPNVWEFDGYTARDNENGGIRVWQNTKSNHVVRNVDIADCAEFGIAHGAYGNAYQWLTGVLRNNPIGIRLHARARPGTSIQADGYSLRWEDYTIIDCPIGINVVKSKPAAEIPVLFKNCTINGSSTPVVLHHQNGTSPTQTDLVHASIDGGEFEPEHVSLEVAVPGSVVRGQRHDDTAWKVDHTGAVTDIPAFYGVATAATT